MGTKKSKIINIIVLVVVLVFFIYLTIQLFPVFQSLASENGRLEFKDKIENLGFKGVFMIIGLMISQVFLPILPGEPVEILGGMCFGIFNGLMIILLGAFISTCIIIFLVRIFGRKFIYTFVSREKIEKLENKKIFKDEKRLDLIVFLFFFIPGTPKDLFVYIGALLPINPWKFIIISSIARFPSIISSTIAGANLVDGNWGIIIGAYAITLLLSGVIIYFYSRREPDIKNIV